MQNRKQLYIARGYRAVWEEAEKVAADNKVALSALVSEALREHLERRRKRLAATGGEV